MKLLLINSTNSAFRICKNESENCRPRQECSQFVGFYRASPLILNRTIVYCSMMYCCHFHFKYSFNYCFNCSLNHFWDKQQQPHIRMAKLHKSFTITVTLVVCFVHSFLERGFYVFYAHIGDNLTESRLRGNWNGEWAKPTRRGLATRAVAHKKLHNVPAVPALGGSTAHHVILLL